MLNQKGQAFSVFELMIAGVVAFAILIVLLTVINQIVFNPQANPKDAITQSLKTAGRSGTSPSGEFNMNSGDTIFSTNFQEKLSYDPESVHFCKSNTLTGTMSDKLQTSDPASTGGDGSTSSIKWTGTTTQKFQAKIVCEDTMEALQTDLQSYNTSCSPDCGTHQPCCAVIFEKGQ